MITLKKYANRKVYGELDGKKGYLTLDDISNLIRQGKDIQVLVHNKGKPDHGQDVTLGILKQCLTRLVMPDMIIKEMIQRYKSEE